MAAIAGMLELLSVGSVCIDVCLMHSSAYAGTLFEIGSWLLYWEALNPEPQVLTGKDIQPDQSAAAAAKPTAAAAAPAGPDTYHTTPDFRPDADVIYDRSTGKTYQLYPVENQRARLLTAGQKQQYKQQYGKKAAAAAEISSSRWPSLGTEDLEAPRVNDSASSAAVASAAGGHSKVTPVGSDSSSEVPHQQQWRWFGFRFHDIGFMASFLQLVGATIFWVS